MHIHYVCGQGVIEIFFFLEEWGRGTGMTKYDHDCDQAVIKSSCIVYIVS